MTSYFKNILKIGIISTVMVFSLSPIRAQAATLITNNMTITWSPSCSFSASHSSKSNETTLYSGSYSTEHYDMRGVETLSYTMALNGSCDNNSHCNWHGSITVSLMRGSTALNTQTISLGASGKLSENGGSAGRSDSRTITINMNNISGDKTDLYFTASCTGGGFTASTDSTPDSYTVRASCTGIAVKAIFPTILNSYPSEIEISYLIDSQIFCNWTNVDEDKIIWQISKDGTNWVDLEDNTYNNTEFSGTKTRTVTIRATDYEFQNYYIRTQGTNFIGTGTSDSIKIVFNKGSFYPQVEEKIGVLGFTRNGQSITKTVKISQSSDFHWEYSINNGINFIDVPESGILNVGGVVPGINNNIVSFTVATQGEGLEGEVVATVNITANDLNMRELWIRARTTNNVSGENQTMYTDEQKITYDMDNFYDWVKFVDKNGNEKVISSLKFVDNTGSDESLIFTPNGESGTSISGSKTGDIIFNEKRIGYKKFKTYHQDLDGKKYSNLY